MPFIKRIVDINQRVVRVRYAAPHARVSAMKMTLKHSSSTIITLILSVFILLIITAIVSAADTSCNGYETMLFANDKVVITICHGPYTKIDKKRLDQWQSCDDAMILIKDKKLGTTSKYVDCLSDAGKQIRVHGDVFMLRHFQTTYPGFKSEPLLIEAVDLRTNKKTYTFEKQLRVCTKKDIDDAAKQIDSTLAKPFDGNKYFTSVYGGFYRLRDCTKSDPSSVLSILRRYQTSGNFDGEVAETLNFVIDESEIIRAASKH